MAPEYGATCGIFPIDEVTLDYLRLTGRAEAQIALVREYAKKQGLWRHDGAPDAVYTDVLHLDLGTRAALARGTEAPAGPRRARRHAEGLSATPSRATRTSGSRAGSARVKDGAAEFELKDGAVVIAAITSCTNTSNPAVMIGAALVARNARRRGLTVQPWVKTSLAPGSKVVTEYLQRSELMDDLEALGFNVVGYGCTTCIGNSGPLNAPISKAINDNKLSVASVLSGNRNFEGRVHQEVRMNFLASPPLVVAYALAGTVDIDLTRDPIGRDAAGKPVYLRDIWPTAREVQQFIGRSVSADMFSKTYADVFHGDERWRGIAVPESEDLRLGRRQHLHPEPALLRRHGAASRRACRPCAARAASRCSATRSRPTTSRPRAPSGRTRRPASTCRSTASCRPTSTATARAAATTRS